MWQNAGVPPVAVQYEALAVMQADLAKIINEGGWIEIRSGKGTPDFEEYIKASSVIHYVMEVW